jgi:hypothetical protein
VWLNHWVWPVPATICAEIGPAGEPARGLGRNNAPGRLKG